MKDHEGFWIPKNRVQGTSCATCSECGGSVYGKNIGDIIKSFDTCPHCGIPINMMPFAAVTQ